MKKTKLAICMEDKEYQKRFLKCFMHHYEQIYEVHVFDSEEELTNVEKEIFPVLLLEGGCKKNEFSSVKQIIKLADYNDEEFENKEKLYCVAEKFQEVYKIEQIIKHTLQEMGMLPNRIGRDSGIKKIGVFSIEAEGAQLPFCKLLGEECGETEKVLLIDLQMFSGLGMEGIQEKHLTMENLLAAALSGDYTSNLLLGAIQSEKGWDDVYPVTNHQCLIEASKNIYDKMLQMLVEELGYQTILINFGIMFEGIYEWMENCDQFFFLCSSMEGETRREMVFQQELKRQEKVELLERMIHLKVPPFYEDITDQIVQQWRWSTLGDLVRNYI